MSNNFLNKAYYTWAVYVPGIGQIQRAFNNDIYFNTKPQDI